jgi:hypothetical protein
MTYIKYIGLERVGGYVTSVIVEKWLCACRITVPNQNYIHEEVAKVSCSGNTCHHSVHNLVSSRFLLKKE